MTTEDAILHLNSLTQTCRDGELGYLTAAEHVKNTGLQTVFGDYARQRREFARHLQAEVERLGGNPIDSSSFAAALHRGWMDLKSGLTGGDGAAIIAACETGEDAAAAAFERVVNLDISGQTKSLVENQWRKIKEAHAHMQRLKEETTSADFPKNE
jgi:uncharacterized protein (TIGR02284 family)